jgi:ABC-type lipoprotein release transport system permease subunit
MIWSVSWRNVWRNKVRSGVVIIAVTLGVFAGVFTLAFMRGMANQRLESAIKTEVSHIQIHTPEFTEVNDIDNYFNHSEKLLEEIQNDSLVAFASRRLILNAMVNSAEKGSGIRLFGIEPEREKNVSDINLKMIEGNYLEPLKRGRPIVIGYKLAEKLGVQIGSKLVIGLLDVNGSPIYTQFRVGGIFQTVNTPFDETTAFVDFSTVRELSNLQDDPAHEIAIYLKDESTIEAEMSSLKEKYPSMMIQEWQEIMPELSYLTESMDLYMYIFILIILLALGFGIVNTMLMVVLERIKEIGMLMAVGMNKKKIFSMIMLETIFLSFTGGVLGIILGTSVSELFRTRGLDLSGLYGEGFSAIGYDSIIYTVVQPQMIVIITVLVILTGVLASVYPALKALRLNPAEAIRTDN